MKAVMYERYGPQEVLRLKEPAGEVEAAGTNVMLCKPDDLTFPGKLVEAGRTRSREERVKEMEQKVNDPGKTLPVKSLLIVRSYHHMNTEKVAKVFAKVLDAEIKTPQSINPEDLQEYDFIGFGSGIDSGKHYLELLAFADQLPRVDGGRAFIFSTSAMVGSAKVAKDHATLREKLQSKGYVVVDEFACKGFNTNSFLKYFGGINKGRPNADDLRRAEEFALNLKQKMGGV